MMEEVIVKFDGREAERHRVDAFAGANSLVGVAGALQRVGHYASTGEVRRKIPYDPRVRFFIEAARPGSLEFPIETVVLATTFLASNGLSQGLLTNALWDLVKFTFGQALGRKTIPATSQIEQIDKTAGGSIEALIDAIEPNLRLAHTAIGGTASSITLIVGNNNIVAALDTSTKDYMMSTHRDQADIMDVSVSSFDANNRTGRVFNLDWGKGVPFNVKSGVPARTLPALSWGLDQYTNHTGKVIRVKYEALRAEDGRIKRIVILDAAA